MVDLTNISTQELFTELAKRKDGKAYLDLAYSKQQMEKAAEDAQEKKGQQILDFMMECFENQAEFYQDRYPYTWDEALRGDAEYIVGYLLEDKELKKLVLEYMDLTV